MYNTYHIHWNGIDLEIRYTPNYSPAYLETYGEPIAHLECRAVSPDRAQLPITETGYRSHFSPASLFEKEGGPIPFVQKWLDSAAESPEWQKHLEEQMQPSLFDFREHSQ